MSEKRREEFTKSSLERALRWGERCARDENFVWTASDAIHYMLIKKQIKAMLHEQYERYKLTKGK